MCACTHLHTQTHTTAKLGKEFWCLNLQVSFRKRDFKHRALMQKVTYTDKASYPVYPVRSFFPSFHFLSGLCSKSLSSEKPKYCKIESTLERYWGGENRDESRWNDCTLVHERFTVVDKYPQLYRVWVCVYVSAWCTILKYVCVCACVLCCLCWGGRQRDILY